MVLTSVIICSHWRTITLLVAEGGNGLQNIFFDYANMAAPRDTIFGLYAHKTVINDIRYIYLLSVFIRGHQRSIEVT